MCFICIMHYDGILQLVFVITSTYTHMKCPFIRNARSACEKFDITFHRNIKDYLFLYGNGSMYSRIHIRKAGDFCY